MAEGTNKARTWSFSSDNLLHSISLVPLCLHVCPCFTLPLHFHCLFHLSFRSFFSLLLLHSCLYLLFSSYSHYFYAFFLLLCSILLLNPFLFLLFTLSSSLSFSCFDYTHSVLAIMYHMAPSLSWLIISEHTSPLFATRVVIPQNKISRMIQSHRVFLIDLEQNTRTLALWQL